MQTPKKGVPPRFDWQLMAFWILAAMVAGAAGVAIGAPSSVGMLGSILLISLAAGGLVLLLWLMQGPGRRLGVFPTRNQAKSRRRRPIWRRANKRCSTPCLNRP